MGSKRQFFFGALALAAILMRLPTFFPTVIDHDESTYILIASQLLDGKIPYVDNLDVKPIGIYLLFALVLKICNSIIAIRLFASLVIALSAYLIYRIHFILFSYERVALATGFLYVICASLHKWSWSANTEIFFQCCSLTALYILLIARRPLHFVLFGLIVGIGFLIKFHIAFDVIAFVVFYFFWQGRDWKIWLKDMTISFLAFLIPGAILILSYLKLNYFDRLYFAMVTIPSGYSSEIEGNRLIRYLAEYYLSFFPFVILMVFGLWQSYRQKWMLRPHWVLLISWTVSSWVGITITGKFFFHYYFQALPVMCLFALTWFMLNEDHTFKRFKYFLVSKLTWIFITFLTITWINQYVQVNRKPDVARLVYHELKPHWSEDKHLYTSDLTILYYLLDTEPPTRYVHSSVLYRPSLIQAYQVDVPAELRNIVDQHLDYYLLPNEISSILREDIEAGFALVKSFSGGLNLYRRLEPE